MRTKPGRGYLSAPEYLNICKYILVSGLPLTFDERCDRTYYIQQSRAIKTSNVPL